MGVAFPRDAEFLRRVERADIVTKCGRLDIFLRPIGTRGFDELAETR